MPAIYPGLPSPTNSIVLPSNVLCLDEPPSDTGIRELSAPDVYESTRHRATGGLLHRLLTLTPSRGTGRLFSSTLIYPYEQLLVRKRDALCCPDFPPAPWRVQAASRPAAASRREVTFFLAHQGIAKKKCVPLPHFLFTKTL